MNFRPALLLSLCAFVFSSYIYAQRGKIITTASTTVMDPNGDGFVSFTNSGFSFDGYYVDEFEISMFGIPYYGDGETLNDTQIGPNCGTTDLTVDTDGHSVYAVLDDDNNLIFRFRLANERPSVEAYTILIDTDGKIGPADPNYSQDNPGFEIDITLIKSASQGITVYNIDGATGCPAPLLSYDYSSHFQVAIADITSCGNADYFYDFYVPFADLTAAFGVTKQSKMQFAAVTNISGTCALAGKISDIGGVNDDDYGGCNYCAFEDLASNQCPVALEDLCGTCGGFLSGATPTPTMEVPLKEGDTQIRGTADPEAEVFIDIFSSNDLLVEALTLDTDDFGNWSATLALPLVQGDSVTAVAQVQGKCDSGAAGSQLSFAVVVLNTTPIITGSSDALLYTENAGALPIDPAIVVTDNEDLDLEYAIVSFVSGFITSQDVLGFTNQNGLTGSYNAVSGELTLSGDGTLAQYQAALRSITYTNTSDNPSETMRTVRFVINDGTVDSAPFERNIDVVAVNDAPIISGTSGATTYTWAPTLINSTMSITDVDNTLIAGALIKVGNNFIANEDMLLFSDQNGIVGTYNATTGELTLTGTASFADYATALNSIQYEYVFSDVPVEQTRRIDFSVTDGADYSLAFSHFITLATTNTPPDITDPDGFSINNLEIEVNEDSSGQFCLNVVDPEDDPVILSSQDPTNGSIVLLGGLCFEYTPDADFFGEDIFVVTVTDLGTPPLSDDITITVQVNPINDYPEVNSLTIDVNEKVTTSICVTVDDIEGDDHFFTSGFSVTNEGTIADGTADDLCFNYTPPTGFIGQDQVEVSICDSTDPSVCSTGIVTVNVIDVNDPPITLINSLPDDVMQVSTSEDLPTTFCFEVIDAEGDEVVLSSITNITPGGTLTENLTEFCFDFEPGPEFIGVSTWEIVVCDTQTPSLCSTVTVNIEVTEVDDPPVISGISGTTNYPWSAVVINGGLIVTDVDNTTLQFATIRISENFVSGEDFLQFTDQNGITGFYDEVSGELSLEGVATLAQYQAALNSIRYFYSYSGAPVSSTKKVDFKVNDGTSPDMLPIHDSNVFSQNVFIEITNNPPVIVDGSGGSIDELVVEVDEDADGEFCLNVEDPDNDLLIISSEDPTNGTVTLTTGLCFEYVPDENFNGEDTFVVTVCDQNTPSLCDEVVVTVNIVPVNDPPVIETLTADANEKTTTEICVSLSDIEDDDHEFISGASVSETSVITDVTTGDLCFNYTPPFGFLGEDQVEITICDSTDPTVCTTSIITITVVDINEAPAILVDGESTTEVTKDVAEDTALAFCLDVNDPENDNIFITSFTSIAGEGQLTEGVDAFCFDFIPYPDFFGESIWEIELCDDQSEPLCTVITVTIDVTPENDAPVLAASPHAVDYTWQSMPINTSITILDVDNTALSSATVSLTNNFISGEDRLEFINQNGITGTFSSSTGRLILTGNATLAQYTQALRSVTYFYNYSAYPSEATRTVEYAVNDGEIESNVETVLVNLLVENGPPDVVDGDGNPIDLVEFEMDEDTEVEFCLNVIDPDNDEVILADLSATNNGDVFLAGGLCFTAMPDENFNGRMEFTVSVCDDNTPTLCDEVTVRIVVLPVNDAPVAVKDTLFVMRAEAGILNLLDNDTDVDNDDLSLTITPITGPANGSIFMTASGELTYQSEVTFRGIDNLTYRITDSGSPALEAVGEVVIVVGDEAFTVYQAVSPNGDGLNDYWHIEGIDYYPQNQVRLYDRYQNLVFEMKGYDNTTKIWTGQANKGISRSPLQDGTYFYHILLGEGGTKSGFIVLKND